MALASIYFTPWERHEKTPKALRRLGFSDRHLFRSLNVVAEVGFEPHGLRVMSPTSYQAALLRDMKIGAGERGRTVTEITLHGILSPGCLPIPPLRHTG